MTRRDMLRLASALPWAAAAAEPEAPRLAPGEPHSPERLASIDAMAKKIAALGEIFEARTHKEVDGWTMPYRLFRPAGGADRLPLVLYLHGAGGLGADNRRQIAGGNLFGSHVWALAEMQRRQPCYIAAPQTDRGWLRYDVKRTPDGPRPTPQPGLGHGARAAASLVESLLVEFPIDPRRVYVTGNSMGGAGTWHMVAQRGLLFAAAVPCCGSAGLDSGAASPATPLWNFHGDADKTVAVTISRERIEARRKAGGKPLYTEYRGVGHDVSRWAYSEPALPEWLFAQRRS